MNNRNRLWRISAVTIGIGCLMLSCTMGGSAEQGNARISGVVSGITGGAGMVTVHLVEEEYDPFDSRSGEVCSTTTDSAGNYEFPEVPAGSYYLYAFDGTHDYVLLDGPHVVAGDEIKLIRGTLQKASVVSIADSCANDDMPVHFYVKGMSVVNAVRIAAQNMVKLTGIPAGIHDVVRHDASTEQVSLYAQNLEIQPGDSIAISQHNRPPRILTVFPDLPTTVCVDTVYSLKITASDPDSDSVSYTLVTSLQSCTLNSESGAIFWTPKQPEVRLSRILVKVADRQGAYSVFIWNLSVRNNAPAPTPEVPGGISESFAESTTVYTTLNCECLSSLSTYRFSWGDGDTTGFSDVPSGKHAWVRPGTYQIRVQVQCSDYGAPSAWSLPLEVTVSEYRITPAPSLAVSDTVRGYDTSYIELKYGTTIRDTTFETISVTVSLKACGSLPLYRFYCNGQLEGDWTEEARFDFMPDSFGTYEFRAAAWCDTSVAFPSQVSEACTVVVMHALRPPVVSGNKNYGLTTPASIKLELKSSTPSDGKPVYYRLSVGFKDLGYENNPVRIGSMEVDTCTDNAYCGDTVALDNFKPTGWFTGNLVSIALSNSSGVCQVQVQAMEIGKMESGWVDYFVDP